MLPHVQPANLPQINALSIPSLPANGGYAIVSATHPDLASDSYVGQLWRVPLDGSGAIRVTRGFRDSAPQLSPDGELIGFLRANAGGVPQLAIVPTGGGEPMVITNTLLGVSEFAFSPDSQQLAYIAAVPTQGRHGTMPGVSSCQEDPRLITELQFDLNGVGYLADRRPQLFVVDVPDPRAEPVTTPVGRAAHDSTEFSAVPASKQLSSGDFEHSSPAWIGDSVVVVSARHVGRDSDLRADLYRFDPNAEEPARITDSANGLSALSSPVVVGDDVYFIGIDLGASGLDMAGVSASVCIVAASGGQARALTDAETVSITGSLVADGDGVLGIDNVRGDGQVIRVDATGEVNRWSIAGSLLSAGSTGATPVAVAATAASPGELISLAEPDRPLTDFAGPLAAEAILGIEQIATATDGYPVHGWVVRPNGDQLCPVILMIHGGPFASYSSSFFDEAQVLAGAGYAVVMCNPRGSDGYGQAHGKSIRHAMGGVDLGDVLAFLDHCLSSAPGLDASRVGVMGGSYGGYLTAWLIAHENRFSAAIVERAFLDGRSFVGAADIGWYFAREYQGAPPAMDAQSPLLLVDRVSTPTLVIHSEQDLRCPIAVARRYYTELKLHGVETELLIFPGENHELSRSGTPHHRLARFEHILDWWARHLVR